MATVWTSLGVAQTAQVATKGAVSARAPFTFFINGRSVDYDIDFEPVMPGQEVEFVATSSLASRTSITINKMQIF